MNEIRYNFKDIGIEDLKKVIDEKILKIIIQIEESKRVLKN